MKQKLYCVHRAGDPSPLSKPMELHAALECMLQHQMGSIREYCVLPVQPAIVGTTPVKQKSKIAIVWNAFKVISFCFAALVYVLFVLIPPEKSSN